MKFSMYIYIYLNTVSGDSFFIMLAATYSPTPSPVQYRRPLTA